MISLHLKCLKDKNTYKYKIKDRNYKYMYEILYTDD